MNLLPQFGALEQHLLLYASWEEYVAVREAFRERPALRLTFDRGRLELMTTSPEHERMKKRLARLVETLAEEFNLRLETAGNMTFQRPDLERGLEADDCFWIAHEAQMRTREEWDATRDPPPDLVLEIEVSRTAVNRMDLYAALGVAEVWRCDGESLRAHLLQTDGSYQPSETSPTFPGIPVAEMIVFLQPNETMDYLSTIRAFRGWVKNHLPPS